jgi:hypothetical protein
MRRAAGPYRGATAVIATMHGKEAAIAPPMRRALGLRCTSAPGIDTDALGTFTGEVERAGTMGETAERKARDGMRIAGVPLGIASEGSFGPHPHVPLIAAGMEVVVFIDEQHGLTLFESEIDDAPVYLHETVRNAGELTGFLRRIRFPDTAVIVRPNAGVGAGDCAGGIVKGVRDAATLAQAVEAAASGSGDGLALVQTDMRAHMNPRRMAAIGRAAERLAKRIATQCPRCDSPGFGKTGVERGLPCSCCGHATAQPRAIIQACVSCGYEDNRPFPHAARAADPSFCPLCNP